MKILLIISFILFALFIIGSISEESYEPREGITFFDLLRYLLLFHFLFGSSNTKDDEYYN